VKVQVNSQKLLSSGRRTVDWVEPVKPVEPVEPVER